MTPELRERLEALGCGNHGCCVVEPTGMATNGPCRCDTHAIGAALAIYRAALREAEEVAEWCAAHEAMVDWDSEGVQVSICNAKEGDDPFSAEDAMYKKCWPEEHAPDLPAAVAALRQRVEGK